MQWKPIIVSIKKNKTMQLEGAKRIREKLKLTWVEVVRRNMTTCNLTIHIALNRVEW